MAFQITSPAFSSGAAIPRRFTCDGDDLSPPLQWDDVPPGTQSFVLIMDDPDAPNGTFTHWVLYNIPQGLTHLEEGTKTDEAGVPGRNDFGRTGYGGPCPPRGHGIHHYGFTLYALDTNTLAITSGAPRAQVEQAMAGHIIGQTRLQGTYERS